MIERPCAGYELIGRGSEAEMVRDHPSIGTAESDAHVETGTAARPVVSQKPLFSPACGPRSLYVSASASAADNAPAASVAAHIVVGSFSMLTVFRIGPWIGRQGLRKIPHTRKTVNIISNIPRKMWTRSEIFFGSGTKNQRIGKVSPARISTAQATFGAVRPFRPLCAPCLRHCRDVEVACSRGESMLKRAEKPQTLTMRLWCRSGCADDRCRPVLAPVFD